MKKLFCLFVPLLMITLFVSCDLIDSDSDATITLSGSLSSSPVLEVSQSSLTACISFTASDDWTADVDYGSSDQTGWISFGNDVGDAGDTSLTIYVDENDSASSRSAIVNIYCNGDYSAGITIVQSANDEGLSGAIFTLATLPTDGSTIRHDTWTLVDEGVLTSIGNLEESLLTTENTRHITIVMPYITSVEFRHKTDIGYDGYDPSATYSLSLPCVTEVEDWSFSMWGGMTFISMPEVTAIGEGVFVECFELEEVYLPKVVTLGEGAFRESGLISIDLPEVTTIGVNAFGCCESLVSAEFDKLTSGGDYFLSVCTGLRYVSLPKVTSVGTGAFNASSSITTIELPELVNVGVSAFGGCSDLTTLYLPKAEIIGYWAFINCDNLETLTLATQSCLTEVGTPLFVFEPKDDEEDSTSAKLITSDAFGSLMNVEGNYWVLGSSSIKFGSIEVI